MDQENSWSFFISKNKWGNGDMSLAYRMDNRTPEQFKKDILEGHKIERQIIDAYVKQIEEEIGVILNVEDNGCDNSGKFLKRATSDADFLVNGTLVEVKFNKKMLKKFHLKQNQLHSYIKQGANILWVNGWETEQPVYTVLKKHDLLFIRDGMEPISVWVWGGKLGYKLSADEFSWKPLKRGNAR